MQDKKTLHVLFVEDSEDDMELLFDALRGEYDRIDHCRVETPAQLGNALQARPWDIILCDHNLPAMDAPAALRIIQQQGVETPVIIVSGSIVGDATAATILSGAADMINKNNLSRLVPAVKRELEKSATVVDLRVAREHIRQIEHYDLLTGLPNRDFLAKRVDAMIAFATDATTFALMVINLSRFLMIPKTLGVDAANETLRLIGERVRKCVGSAGVVASLGGDRFAVLLSDCRNRSELTEKLDRMNEEISRPLKVAGQELFLAKRIGVSMYPQDGRDAHKLILNAEIAMSQMSADAGHGYNFFDPGMNAAEQERLALENALHGALKREEFFLHYQPQFDLCTGRMIGVEALLRWQPAGGAPVSPAEFIPVLEETGLIVPVGEWVLRTACLQNLKWQKAGFPPIRVAVNLSAIQFRQTELVSIVRRVLDETGLDRRFLELEITENIAVHNEESVITALAALRHMGVSLAIDDFGTGYSSLSYLRRFPVHKLKIDRSFVRDINESDDGGQIVKAIISLARNLRLEVIAEGVETEQQLAFLQACGCNDVQGFLFSRPLPGHQLESILDKRADVLRPALASGLN